MAFVAGKLRIGALNKRVRIERPIGDGAWDGAGSGTWAAVANVWAEVKDVLPSRGEKLAEGLTLSARPTRIRMRYRTDIAPSMRFVVDGRTLQIVAGPAELGDREVIEFMAEEFKVSGNPA